MMTSTEVKKTLAKYKIDLEKLTVEEWKELSGAIIESLITGYPFGTMLCISDCNPLRKVDPEISAIIHDVNMDCPRGWDGGVYDITIDHPEYLKWAGREDEYVAPKKRNTKAKAKKR